MVSTMDIGERGLNGIEANPRTAKIVGGSGELGALISAIPGGEGAAISAGAGGPAGAPGQIRIKGGEVWVSAETLLTFKLKRDLHLQRAF